MEPKWRDMCQIELSASTNTGWDSDGRRNPKSSYTQPRLEATAPPVKRHLDCFPGEHVLLKIQKNKGLRLSGLPSSSSSSSSSYVVMHVRRLALAPNLSGTSQPPGVYCAFRAQLFMCPLPLTLHFTSFFHAPRPRRTCTLFGRRAWGSRSSTMLIILLEVKSCLSPNFHEILFCVRMRPAYVLRTRVRTRESLAVLSKKPSGMTRMMSSKMAGIGARVRHAIRAFVRSFVRRVDGLALCGVKTLSLNVGRRME